MTGRKTEPEAPGGFGSVEDWAPFVGAEEATQLLSGLGALGDSQALLEQLTAAVMPGAAAGAAASPEEEARLAALRFRSLAENLPCVAFIASMGHARSEVYINPYIERLLGYTREEWLRDPFLWYWRVHPEDRAAWNEEFARGLVTGGPWQADCRFLAADGRAVWLRGHAQIVRDELQRPLFLQGVAFDIGSIKLAEQDAREARDAALAMLDAIPEGMVLVGAGGNVLHANAAALELLAPAVPATLAELAAALAPGPPDWLLERVAACRSAGAGDTLTVEARGPRTRVQLQCLPRPGDARAPGAVALRLVPQPAARRKPVKPGGRRSR